jgi:hypothetical protein
VHIEAREGAHRFPPSLIVEPIVVDKSETYERDERPDSATSAEPGSRMLPRSMPNETPQAATSNRAAIILALLAVYVVWGSTYLGIKIALQGYAPFALGAIRMVGGRCAAARLAQAARRVLAERKAARELRDRRHAAALRR